MFNGINFTCFQGRVAVDLVVPMTVPTVASPSVLSLASTCTCSPTQVKSLMYVGFVANDSVRKETWGRIWLPMLDFRWIRNDWMNYWSMSWGIESSYTPMRKTNNLARKEPLGHLWFPMLDFHWILDDWMNYWSMSCGIESSYTPMRKNKQFSQKGNIRSHMITHVGFSLDEILEVYHLKCGFESSYSINYSLVEDIDNWTLSYILIIIYWNQQK